MPQVIKIMNRESSFSLQKIPLRRSLVRSNSNDGRLIFPKDGDSNIFWGVGKKRYIDEPSPPSPAPFLPPISNPEPSVRKYMSMRNILSVADIEGASPSVAPENVRNIRRAKENQLNTNNGDLLGQYEKLFSLKQLSPQRQPISNSSAILSNSEYSSPARRFNPTFATTFAMQY